MKKNFFFLNASRLGIFIEHILTVLYHGSDSLTALNIVFNIFDYSAVNVYFSSYQNVFNRSLQFLFFLALEVRHLHKYGGS